MLPVRTRLVSCQWRNPTAHWDPLHDQRIHFRPDDVPSFTFVRYSLRHINLSLAVTQFEFSILQYNTAATILHRQHRRR